MLVVVASLRYGAAIPLHGAACAGHALADALEPVLPSKSLRQGLGSRVRRRIEEDFGITRVADELTRRFAAT